MAFHTLRAAPDTVRLGVFDAEFPPVFHIESGDTVEVQCVSGRDEVMPEPGSPLQSPAELLAILKANPGVKAGHIVTGPISIAGAMPGDTLEIRIDKIEPGANWGYNVIRPLAGTLPERARPVRASRLSRDGSSDRPITVPMVIAGSSSMPAARQPSANPRSRSTSQ